MKRILEKMNHNKHSNLFYQFLGLLILADLFLNKEDVPGEITGWLSIAALVLLSAKSLYIIASHKGHVTRIVKKEEQTLLVSTLLWLALFMLMKNPFALPVTWVVYGTLIFLIAGLALTTYVLLGKDRS